MNLFDGTDTGFMQWMEDFEVFQAAIQSDNSYTSTLANSLSLSVYEFYRNIRSAGVSASLVLEWMISLKPLKQVLRNTWKLTSNDTLFSYLSASSMLMICVFLFFRADLDKRKAEKEQLEEERREKEMEKLRKDIESSKGGTVVLNTGLKDRDGAEKMMLEKDDDEDFQIEEDSDGAIDEDDGDEEMKI